MERIRTIVIEDNPLARRNLEKIAAASETIDMLGSYGTLREASAMLVSAQVELLVFSTHHLHPQHLSFIFNLHHPPLLLFFPFAEHYPFNSTAFALLEALFKPILLSRALSIAVARAEQKLIDRNQGRAHSFLQFKDGAQTISLRAEDIIVFNAKGDYVKIETLQGNFLVRLTLKLLAHSMSTFGFVRIHRKHIISIQHIKSVSARRVLLNNGAVLPIGIHYKRHFLQQIGVL